MFGALIAVILAVLDIYWWVILVAVIASWLVSFGVINAYNPMARSILQVLQALTEPVFRQIRRVVPPIGGLDLSPIVVLLIIFFLQRWLTSWLITGSPF